MLSALALAAALSGTVVAAHKRTCAECGADFQPSGYQAKKDGPVFCGSSCASAIGRRRRWERDATTLQQRLERHVIRRGDDECWSWSGFRYRGYGRLRVGPNAVGAHRVAYELYVGPITDGLTVLHKCDNPECTNPQHLRLGTNADNNLDRDAKGRNSRGENHRSAVLSVPQVRQIRRDIECGHRQVDLASRYGVSPGTIAAIKHRRSWRHI